MFKRNKILGQMSGEYALLLFSIVAVIATMTVYVKRSMQGHLRDARFSMISTIRSYAPTDAGGVPLLDENGNVIQYTGLLWKEYEPYYGNRLSQVSSFEDNQKVLLPGQTSGIYRETMNQVTNAKTFSEQLPPKNSD